MEEDMGAPLESIFSQISSLPVAAASLGQVYQATLRETGEQVAIKVGEKRGPSAGPGPSNALSPQRSGAAPGN